MITEDYASFETAKLLKEKGFDCASKVWYSENTSQFGGEKYTFICPAPTLQIAMKWLREVHKLSIEPYYDEVLTWVVDIKHIGKHTDTREFETVRENCYKTYEQACEAAIKYCLENLI